jgi:hypothetical protein
MGAWGLLAFENDTALDWVAPITASKARQRVGAALSRVQRTSTLDSDLGCVGLAACEIVASASGHPHEATPESLDRVIYRLSLEDLDDFRYRATACLGRIAGQRSELAELWEQSATRDEWVGYVEGLARRLGENQARVDEPPKPVRRRRPRLGDVYEVQDEDLGFGYFQYVANTRSARVVLALNGWFPTKLRLDDLEDRFSKWTRTGFLDRTWLPPDVDGCTLIGSLGLPMEAQSTVWMLMHTMESEENPDGWWVVRDSDEPGKNEVFYSGVEFSRLYGKIDQSLLAPWSIGSVVGSMKYGRDT